jgi:hypothetical protein
MILLYGANRGRMRFSERTRALAGHLRTAEVGTSDQRNHGVVGTGGAVPWQNNARHGSTTSPSRSRIAASQHGLDVGGAAADDARSNPIVAGRAPTRSPWVHSQGRPGRGAGWSYQQRDRSLSTHWRSVKRRLALSILILRHVSTTLPACSRPRATLRGQGHSTSAPSRSGRRRSAPSIPIRRRASTPSRCYLAMRATSLGRGYSSSAPSR